MKPRDSLRKIDRREIVLLPQMRGDNPQKYRQGIQALAANVGENGLINPVSVAYFTSSEIKSYTDLLRELFDFDVIDYRLGQEVKALVAGWEDGRPCLIAGHRRYLAVDWLAESKPDAYKHQFARHRLWCHFYEGITAERALRIQIAENVGQKKVHPSRQVRMISILFQICRRRQPRLTMRAYADELGITPESVSQALRFTELPIEVQREILGDATSDDKHKQKGHIAWGCGLELVRAQRKLLSVKVTDDQRAAYEAATAADIVKFAQIALIKKNRQVLRLALDPHIAKIVYGQLAMFEDRPDLHLCAQEVIEHIVSREGREVLEAAGFLLRGLNISIRQAQIRPQLTNEVGWLKERLCEAVGWSREYLDRALLSLPLPREEAISLFGEPERALAVV